MSVRGYMLLVVCVGLAGALFSQAQKEQPKKTPVDIKANVANRYPDLGENAIVLTGDVVFHHNGTVISCDSAVRYSDRRIDCFKNVIINKDSIFVYGDRVEYNGEQNLARVYSPVVKVIDGDAVLYTYNFSFNTLNNIGIYYGGGVMYQKDNIMESERGYYYSDLREVVAVKGVEMKNDDYSMKGDSVRYNMDTKIAHFYSKSYIWSAEGDIITADRGRYNTADSTYFFYRNAYVLTDVRETWADTIDYRAKKQDALLYGNIQINDEENASSAFGDFGQYWGDRGEVMITRRPTLLNYNEEQNNGDTLYMRADTIFMFVTYPSDRRARDTVQSGSDPYLHLKWADSLPDSVRTHIADSLTTVIGDMTYRMTVLRHAADSIMNALNPPLPADSVSKSIMTDTLQSLLEELSPSMPEDISAMERVRELLPDSLSGQQIARLLEMLDDEVAEGISPLVSDSIDVAALKNVIESESKTKPQPNIPPEVSVIRTNINKLTAELDSLRVTEKYIRPKTSSGQSGGTSIDNHILADSLAQVDSLARVDSLAHLDKKSLKLLQKAERRKAKDEKAAAKRTLRREKAAIAAAKRAEKALQMAEKEALRAEKRALRAEELARKATERLATKERKSRLKASEKFAARAAAARAQAEQRWVEVGRLRSPDSLAKVDSLARLDSISRIDSLAKLQKLPPAEPVKQPDTTQRIVRAWHNVKIWRTDMQAVCDSLAGFSRDSTVSMYQSPILWHGDSQIVCDSLTLFTDGENIDRAEFYGNPIMGSTIDELQFNQVKGRTMTSWFREGAVYKHDVSGNAEAYYYIQEEGEPEPVAFIVLTSSDMTFVLEDQFLKDIIARGDVKWPVYPVEQIPSDQPTLLQGFKWMPERKPRLEDVFERYIRPTEREFHQSLEGPKFPIGARIDRRREYLIHNNLWADRIDPLPAYAVEFVSSLTGQTKE
jgi:lipopolysaccharide export system protein LptA